MEIRLLKEAYQSVYELTKLKDFPAEKLDIIKLYLSINKKNEFPTFGRTKNDR